MDYAKEYDPKTDGVLLFDSEKTLNKSQINEAFVRLNSVIENRPKSIVVEVNAFRKNVPILLKALVQINELKKAACLQAHRVTTDNNDKKYQRWTENEDKLLIDLVCDESISMLELSTTMGRTVPAIKTRLSHLVGVKRISQKIAGRFIGKADGEEIDSELVGIIYKTDCVKAKDSGDRKEQNDQIEQDGVDDGKTVEG